MQVDHSNIKTNNDEIDLIKIEGLEKAVRRTG